MSSSTADPLADIRRRAPVEGAWLVGGSVRDMLLGRPVLDIDLVVAEDPRTVAKRLAGRVRGLAVSAVGATRCLAGGVRRADGRHRRVPWRHRGRSRACAISPSTRLLSPWTTVSTSIRMEAARISISVCCGRCRMRSSWTTRCGCCGCRGSPTSWGSTSTRPPSSWRAARPMLASRPSGERIFMEMKRLLGGDRPAEALRLADRIGVLEAVLPEVAPMRGVTQSGHHQLDVWEHTLHVVEAAADIADHPEHYLPGHAQMVGAELAADAGDELTVAQALRLAALFHDISKPQTRVQTEARISFMGHDREGADAAAAVLGALEGVECVDPVMPGAGARAPGARVLDPAAAARPQDGVSLSAGDRALAGGERGAVGGRPHGHARAELAAAAPAPPQRDGRRAARADRPAAGRSRAAADARRRDRRGHRRPGCRDQAAGRYAGRGAGGRQRSTTREEALAYVREQVR